MTQCKNSFVLGVDLDGVCANFYGRMREIAAEWLGKPISSLTEDVTWGLKEWGLQEGEYEDLHHFAVTQRGLYETMQVIEGAPQSLRNLSKEGIYIRIITHRLFISNFHEIAIAQTVRWLDKHAIPYRDLCFMKDKHAVGADLYIEDTPHNILNLREAGKSVITFSNSTNRDIQDEPGGRANDWVQVANIVRQQYYYPWRK